jgi:hypothetical protein
LFSNALNLCSFLNVKDPSHLTTLLASMACYGDSFIFYLRCQIF